jgi:hypothetical protein
MVKQRRITPLQAGNEGEYPGEPAFELHEELPASQLPLDGLVEESGDRIEIETARPGRAVSIVLAAAGLVCVAWTGTFAWGVLESGTLEVPRSATLFAYWALPVILVLLCAMLAIRVSGADARRARATLRILREEAEIVDRRLTRINGELGLARQFLANQTRELDALGREAADRIGGQAGELERLVGANIGEVERLHQLSEASLRNLQELRGELPAITGAMRDATNAIGKAGYEAAGRAEALIAAFDGVAALSGESDRRLSELASRFEGWFSQLDQRGDALADAQAAMLETNFARLTELQDHLAHIGEEERQASVTRLDALREELARIDILTAQRRDRLAADIAEREQRLEAFEESAVTRLTARMAELDAELAARRDQEIAQTLALTDHAQKIVDRMRGLDSRLEEVIEHFGTAGGLLDSQANALEDRLAGVGSLTSQTDDALAGLTDASVRLLELLRASTKHSREDLAEAIAAGDQRLHEMNERGQELRSVILATGSETRDLSDYLVEANKRTEETAQTIAHRMRELREEGERTEGIGAELASELAGLLDQTATLASAVEQQVERAAANAGDRLAATIAEIRDTSVGEIDAATPSIAERSASAVGDAIRREGDATVAELTSAIEAADEQGRRSVQFLREQMGRLNDLTRNLEARVAKAEEAATERMDGDFARRAGLLIEGLKSVAIDVDKMLANEVSDTDWARYLKGDRGIFARRVVSLLDNRDLREVTRLYQSDAEFRDNLRRYVHDFEALLRMLLATTSGHALSVTLLGSDIGKLYVALAQAIERLRA